MQHYSPLEGNNVVKHTTGNEVLWFYYDATGNVIGFEYLQPSSATSIAYFYVKNLQGDIIAITDASGNKVVEYFYDSWGKLLAITGSLASTVGVKNPYRYRSYRYDTELGFYYLNSRYYDPEVKRFLNADTIDLITATPGALSDKNLFNYCDNNPIVRKDTEGDFWHIVAGALIGGVSSFISAKMNGYSTESAFVAAGFGAISGAVAATPLGMVGQIIVGAATAGAQSYLCQGIDKGFDNINYTDVVSDTVMGGIIGSTGGISKGDSKHLLTQGYNATKRVISAAVHQGYTAARRELAKAGTYYISQTVSMFYKSSIRSAARDAIIGDLGSKALSAVCRSVRRAIAKA